MNTIFLFFYLLFPQSTTETVNLSITVENINSQKGSIEIGLFNTHERFLEKNQAYKRYSIKVTKSSETINIKDLPVGDYAVSLYHDKNSDGECNRNFFGIPKEPYAFSNNFRPKFSAPKFEDCKFSLTQDHNISIRLIH